MLPLATYCHTHCHLHPFYFMLFKFKDLVAKQHPTNTHTHTHIHTPHTHIHTCMHIFHTHYSFHFRDHLPWHMTIWTYLKMLFKWVNTSFHSSTGQNLVKMSEGYLSYFPLHLLPSTLYGLPRPSSLPQSFLQSLTPYLSL